MIGIRMMANVHIGKEDRWENIKGACTKSKEKRVKNHSLTWDCLLMRRDGPLIPSIICEIGVVERKECFFSSRKALFSL